MLTADRLSRADVMIRGAVVLLLAVATLRVAGAQPPGMKKQLVAHRGASAYAPEHTLAAYRLAIEQGADFVEQDLAVTKDGILVCIHDLTLERTTNVEETFPERYSRETFGRNGAKRWIANDFTTAERSLGCLITQDKAVTA